MSTLSRPFKQYPALLSAILVTIALSLNCKAGLQASADRAQAFRRDLPAGSLVYASGTLQAAALGDRAFVDPRSYLRIERYVEVYAFGVDAANEKNCLNLWTRSPDLEIQKSAACAGKFNRASYVGEKLVQAELKLTLSDGSLLPLASADYRLAGATLRPLQLSEVTPFQNLRAAEDRLYIEPSCIEAPRIECERLQILVAPLDANATYTVFGRWNGSALEAAGADQHGLFVVAPGDRDAALAAIPEQ
ncbi:MAG: hypothetical protein K1X75_17915 [Leptospirales bacterium]|nr:hypothetical protein [Leptospirales bacterium]